MQIWIFITTLVLLVIYVIIGIGRVNYANFKLKNTYSDESVTYDEGRPDWVPKNAFLIDCHTHTNASDGLLSPRQLLLWHISNGYDGMVVSDHNTMESVEEIQKIAAEEFPNFVVIPGFEFTTNRVHLNVIGNKTINIKPNILWASKKMIKKLIEDTHKQNALIQFNHRDAYPHKLYISMQWYLKNNIDGWEIHNGFGFTDHKAPKFIAENKDKRIMYQNAGTDIHDPTVQHRAYTEILSDDHSVNGVIEALRKGLSKPYYNKEAEMKRVKPEQGKLIINPEREKFIHKWRWVYWAGKGIFRGREQNLLLLLSILVLGTSFIASIVL